MDRRGLGRAFLCAVLLVVPLLLGGCGSTPAVHPRAAAPSVLPSALDGVWQTRFQGGPQYLRLAPGAWQIYVVPDDMAKGRLAVSGNRLTLSGSNACYGTGVYTYRLTGGVLTFTADNNDPCPRRDLFRLTWRRRG